MSLIAVYLYISIWNETRGTPIEARETRDYAIHTLKMNILFGHNPKEYAKLLPCLNNCKIIETETGKGGAFAFVFARGALGKTVFVDKTQWFQSSTPTRAHVLVHECSHIMLKTSDYAYYYDPKFSTLPLEKAKNNADTIAYKVFTGGI